MPQQNRLLLFYFLTTFGFSITGIGTFLCIEKTFHDLGYLGLALSLRTLSACILGYFSNYIIQKINIKKSFICSLVVGLISICSIFYGFNYQNFYLVLVGLLLIGLPLTLTNIVLTVAFKVSAKSGGLYRKYSGSRELIFGVIRLLACLLVPVIIYKSNINIVILLNLIAYFFGIILFINIDFGLFPNANPTCRVVSIDSLIMKSRETWAYICQITSSMILIAFIPLLASSNQISFTKSLPFYVRESLWSLEAVTMILGGFIYLLARKMKDNGYFKSFLMLNSSFIFLFLLSPEPIAIIVITMIISVSIMLSFYRFRDDYIIKAGAHARLIEAHAAFSSVMKDLICSISPVILAYIFSHFTLSTALSIIFMIQVTFYLLYQIINKTSEVQLNFQR